MSEFKIDDLGNLIRLESFREDCKKGLDSKGSILLDNAFIALLQEAAVVTLDPIRILLTLAVNKSLTSKLEFEVTDHPMYEGHRIPAGHLFNTSIPFPKEPFDKDFLDSLFEEISEALANHLASKVKKNQTLILYNITCEKVYNQPIRPATLCLDIRGTVKTKDGFRILK